MQSKGEESTVGSKRFQLEMETVEKGIAGGKRVWKKSLGLHRTSEEGLSRKVIEQKFPSREIMHMGW